MSILHNLVPTRIQLPQQLLKLITWPHVSILRTMYEMECSVKFEDSFVGFGRGEGGCFVVEAVHLSCTESQHLFQVNVG
jgi:hypothetical protein